MHSLLWYLHVILFWKHTKEVIVSQMVKWGLWLLIWITSLSPCRGLHLQACARGCTITAVLPDADAAQFALAVSSSLGLYCLQWRKQSNGGSSLPPQPGGKSLFLKLAQGETESLLSCWLLKSRGWLSKLVILHVPAQTQHLTAWQSLTCLFSAPWD